MSRRCTVPRAEYAERMPFPRSGAFPIALAAGALLAAVSAASPARACSEICEGGVRLPYEQSIPGNLIAFDVLDSALPFSLETLDGEPVPASVALRGGKPVFETDEPVAPGTLLQLRITQCTIPYDYRFSAAPFVEFEPIAPTLDVFERFVEAAGTEGDVSVVRLRYRGPDPMNVAPHLVQTIVSIDGRPLFMERTHDDGSIIEVRSSCSGRELIQNGHPCRSVPATPPGIYRVEARTHIVGAEVDPEPLVLEIDTSCPEGDLGAADDSARDAGCSFAASQGSSAALALLAGLALAFGYRRHRRG